MNKNRIRFFFGCILLLCTASRAQSSLDTLAMRAIMVNQLFPQEKVYLHFDNTSYYLGETMWFKAYVVGTNDDVQRPQSKVLYVELVAPEGYVVETKKYKLDERGCCNGEFDLRESILSGYYTVRAYTRYMLNWGDEAIFTRTFPVYDAVSGGHYEIKEMLDRSRSPIKNDKMEQAEEKMYRLEFYPEGGHLVDGMPCVVAYELLHHDGKPMKDTITIFDGTRPLLCTVPEHNGKGTFEFTPLKDRKYRAEVRYAKEDKRGRWNEYIYQKVLPTVEDYGVGISVKEEDNTFVLDIRNNFDTDIPLGCTVLNKGRMQLYESFSSSVHHKRIVLHPDSLPEGVNRLVVFASLGIPLAERQFFVRHDHVHPDDLQGVRLKVTISEGVSIEEAELQPYEKVTLTIAREDGKPIPPEASLSLSVTDADSREEVGMGNSLYTHLLLGSELKGYIPDASRYFEPTNARRLRELDLVMLTHGWTSYEWSVLSNRHFDLKHPAEKGITVIGEFLDFSYAKNKRGQLDATPQACLPLTYHSMIFSMQKGSVVQDYEFMTDGNGCFQIKMDDFYGDRVVSLLSENRFGRNSRPVVLIDKFFSPASPPNRNMLSDNASPHQVNMVKVGNLDYLLPELEITDEQKRNRFHLPPVSEIRFSYLNEWEQGYESYWRLKKSFLEDQNESSIKETDIYTAGDGLVYVAPIHCYADSEGETTLADDGTTPYKVVGATFLRNFVGCYWLHYVVADGMDSTRFDEEYLRQLKFLDPFKFKEFVISSDYSLRSQIPNELEYWAAKYNSVAKYHKSAYKSNNGDTYYSPQEGLDYYHGFYVNQILPPLSLLADIPSYYRFIDNAMGMANWSYNANSGKWIGRGSFPMKTPNYVACMIPYTEEEIDSLYLPNGDNGNKIRFTHLQGYSRSKKFYSPAYHGTSLSCDSIQHIRTLYWNPMLSLETTLSLHVPREKNLSICLEGMDGMLIFGNQIITNNTRAESSLRLSDKDLDIWRNIVDTILPSPAELIAMHRCNAEGIRLLKEKQYADAVASFKEGALLFYPPAIANLGICYHRGWGVDRDVDMAYRYYLLAAEHGDASACHNLGGCYLNGEAVAGNDSLAFVWYQRAAEQEYAQSQVMLGKFYEMGLRPVQQSDSIALQYYLPASEKYPEAAFSAAMILASRDSISGKREKELRNSQTIKLIECAAQNGLLAAQKYLSNCYRDGYYVKKNKKRMTHYLSICAQQGDEQSMLRLARCYERGIGLNKDEQKAYEYYKQLADKGNAYATMKTREYEYYREFRFDKTKLEDL